jgi:hypothetical protein
MRSFLRTESFVTTSKHKIVVPSSFPLGEIIRNCEANGRIVKWSVELGEFNIEFCPRQAIK